MRLDHVSYVPSYDQFADTDHLADTWFKSEILDGLNGAEIEFIDPPTNDGEYGIVGVQLTTPTGSVVLD
jgi:hypothetical protein